MCHGVYRPRVLGIDLHGTAAEPFSLAVVSRLLQPERVHAEQIAVVAVFRSQCGRTRAVESRILPPAPE